MREDLLRADRVIVDCKFIKGWFGLVLWVLEDMQPCDFQSGLPIKGAPSCRIWRKANSNDLKEINLSVII